MLCYKGRMKRSIEGMKAHRRERVGLLLDRFGQTELSALVDIAASYLYQMGKAIAEKGRNVSDANAGKIERALSLPPGWLDSDDPLPDLLATPKARPLPAAAIDDLQHVKIALTALFDRMAEAQPGEARILAARIRDLSRGASNPFQVSVLRVLEQAADEARATEAPKAPR
jgi:hypothetical protein